MESIPKEVTIIPVSHSDPDNKSFESYAVNKASRNEITLFMENYFVEDYKNGEMQKNVYAIEKKIIFSFTDILSISEYIYDFTTDISLLGGGFSGNGIVCKKYSDMQDFNKTQVSETVEKCINIFDSMLKKSGIPVKEIEKLFSTYIKLSDFKDIFFSKKSIFLKTTLFMKNAFDIKIALQNFALFLSKKIKDDLTFSENVRNHKSLSEDYINDLFKLDNITSESFEIHTGLAIVELRNNIFAQKILEFIQLSSSNIKEIWFIVGREHSDGLINLLKSKEIQVCEKNKSSLQITKKPSVFSSHGIHVDNSIEAIKEILSTIVPNKAWKVSLAHDLIWCDISNENEGKEIIDHFRKNEYENITIQYRSQQSKNVPIIHINGISYTKLKVIPPMNSSNQLGKNNSNHV